uniref:Uncharacterized protein n=1 Tax=Arundo donax TaxID=35708 RepID=A0A0A8ZC24_ARUDO
MNIHTTNLCSDDKLIYSANN